ncbi:MAG: signal recognition particle-docking protein FtsY [Thermoleophilia bacterium]
MADPHQMFSGLGDVPVVEAVSEADQGGGGFFRRLVDGLSKSSKALTGQIQSIAFDPDDAEAWEQLEEALLLADCGVPATVEIIGRLERRAAAGGLTPGADLAPALAEEIADLLAGAEARIDVSQQPTVILMVGVNGTGKTTTVGKLAEHLRRVGKTVVIAAADTFRAAADEQLQVWAERADADFVGSAHGGDPAAVAFDGIEAAVARGRDVVLVDTAGRLQNQVGLMDELAKIRRVINGRMDGAPHETLLVVDATTGQNGLQQARLFGEATPLTGIVLTKLDGTAKGGIALAIAHEIGVPIKLIGVGESLDDLRPFDAASYARALLGLGAE